MTNSTSSRIVLCASLAAVLTATGFVGAPRAATPEWAAPHAAPAHPTRRRATAHDVEARIAELRARLQITAGQEAQWSAVAQAMRDNAHTIRGLAEMRARNQRTMTALDDLRSYEQLAEAHADGTQKLLPRFEALYDNMSDAQKKTADTVFARFDRPGGPKRHVS
jgi:ABC-type transporter Mla subunit MlaD